jgi:hypothetical protein
MDDKIEEVARKVASIQAEYDWEDHRTTGAVFMQTHGIKWSYERDRILREIDARRTKAIWSLDRLLQAQARPPAPSDGHDSTSPPGRIIH